MCVSWPQATTRAHSMQTMLNCVNSRLRRRRRRRRRLWLHWQLAVTWQRRHLKEEYSISSASFAVAALALCLSLLRLLLLLLLCGSLSWSMRCPARQVSTALSTQTDCTERTQRRSLYANALFNYVMLTCKQCVREPSCCAFTAWQETALQVNISDEGWKKETSAVVKPNAMNTANKQITAHNFACNKFITI